MLLTFDFKTVEEAQDHLAWLLKKPVQGQQPVSPAAPVEPAKDSDPASKKHGPKPKAEVAAEIKSYTIDDCRDALSQLFDKRGRDAAKCALEAFKVARIGELTAPVYAQFIETCANLAK